MKIVDGIYCSLYTLEVCIQFLTGPFSISLYFSLLDMPHENIVVITYKLSTYLQKKVIFLHLQYEIHISFITIC